LRRTFQQSDPQIIHTHSYLLRYVLPAVTGLGASQLVHTVHNLADREVDAAGRTVHRIAYRRGVHPVAVGEQVAASFREMYGFAPAATIRNGIDTARFRQSEAAAAWKSSQGFGPTDKLAVSVARLEPQKNPLGLISAFAQAFPDGSGWHLLLAGDGTLRHEATVHAEALGLGNRVRFLGAQSDVAPILAASDMFVLASDWEGTPLAVMEAVAAGLPVVATNVGGLPEVVEDGESGILVAPGDMEALAAAMRSLSTDSTRLEAFRAAARARAYHYDVTTMVDAYAKLFRGLVGGSA
ncbi:MAG: glycosyltransferase, partial [Bryobacterales bacterium]|nr:glycosyltransferase [Bryobacterales bacterium]